MTHNNKIGSTEIKRKKRLEKKYNSLNSIEEKLCLCVGKALCYLDLKSDNIVDLKRVCKYWAEKLNERIFQRYLIHENALSPKSRLVLYKVICRPPYSEAVYRKMVKEMP